MAYCNVRQPNGVLRCELLKGHDDDGSDHGAITHDSDMPDQVVWEFWQSERGRKGQRRAQRQRVNRASGKQLYRQGRLAGIRDERLAMQEVLYEQRLLWWHPGSTGYGSPPPGPHWCQHCLQAKPAEELQLHHYTQRSLGVRATPDDQGDERPEELGLICQGPGSCHDAEHD